MSYEDVSGEDDHDEPGRIRFANPGSALRAASRERIETLEDMLDETSVDHGNPELIEELTMLKHHERMLERTGNHAPNIDLI